MDRCAYCGEKVGEDALYVDDEVFCSEECMREFGSGGDDYDVDDDAVAGEDEYEEY